MTSEEDLQKLFEAAMGEKQAPSRFGTPEEQRKFSPVPNQVSQPGPSKFQAAPVAANPYQQASAPSNAFQAAPAPAPAAGYQQAPPQQYPQPQPAAFQPFQAAPAPQSAFTAAPAPQVAAQPVVQRDAQGETSLDTGLNAELASILDMKIARAKKRRRRGLAITLLFFVGVAGGSSAWVASNPERVSALKKTIADIKSVGDLKGMVAQYQKALDKVAVRSQQIDAATVSMGVDPTSAAGMADQGFDAEMREMMGEDGGPTTASRNAKLTEKFKSVQESGSLMPGGKSAQANEPTKSK